AQLRPHDHVDKAGVKPVVAEIVAVERPALARRAGAEIVGGQQAGMGLDQAHCDSALSRAADMIGNTLPLERTQNIALPSISISSPISTSSYITGRATSASRRPRTWR